MILQGKKAGFERFSTGSIESLQPGSALPASSWRFCDWYSACVIGGGFN